MAWAPHNDAPHPWRKDPRLANRFTESGYPDDLQVIFPNPDSARGGKHEVMWVTVIAASISTGQYLGILINPPSYLQDVKLGDNVVFRWDERLNAPRAVTGMAGTYAAGWPSSTDSFKPDSILRAGVRAYRSGANGHNMPGIDECIAVLSRLSPGDLRARSADFQYIAAYTLGRCSAEKYATLEAVAAFRRAISIYPDSLDSQMGLLAEYSVLANTPPAKLTKGTEDEWERAFLTQLAEVRRRFATDTATLRSVDFILAPHAATDTTSLSAATLSKRHRIGFALLRWKQR